MKTEDIHVTRLGTLKSTTFICLSAAALLAISGCQHATRLTVADAGGAAGIDAPGGNGGGGNGGGGETGGGGAGSGNGAGGGSGSGGSSGSGSGAGGASDDRGNGGGGNGGGGGGSTDNDRPGGDDDDGGVRPSGDRPTPASYDGGFEELTDLLAGSGGALLYSSGNTIASPHLSRLGAGLRDEGFAALPAGARVLSGATQTADSLTAPMGKLSVMDRLAAGSGDPNSAQLAGVALASTGSSQGTLASLNMANANGAAASAGVAGGQILGASALQSGVLSPTGRGALLDASVAGGDAAAITILPAGVSGSQNIDSLLSANLGGEALVNGGDNAAVNVNAAPGGAAGVATFTDAADLNALLAPVNNEQLAPVTATAQTVVDNSSAIVGGLGDALPSTSPVVGQISDSQGQIDVTVLNAPVLGGGDSSTQLIGAAAISSSDDAGTLASINALNSGGAAASLDIAGGDIASIAVLPDAGAADLSGSLSGLGQNPAQSLEGLTGDLTSDLTGDLTSGLVETDISGPVTIGEGLEGLGGGLFR